MVKMMSHKYLVIVIFYLWVDSTICVEVACELSNDTSLKAVCECTARTVNCRNRGLREWPVGIPVNTRYLYMNDNNLRTIDDDTLLELRNLLIIEINNNSLTRLPTFPKSIGSVYAKHNLLTDISTAFNNLPRLHTIDIQNNNIIELSNTTFNGSPFITTFDISYNHLHSIEAFTFASLQNTSLILSINFNPQLKELCENSFALTTMFSVTIVIAYNHNLVNLSSGTFKNLSTGSFIHLHRNGLRSIPSKAFQGGNISYIKLEDNQIRFIHKDAFIALDNIEELRLAYNNLTEIPILPANSKFRLLDLSWNYITSLEGCQLPSVGNMLMNKNNIQRV
ncbi:leucine-rich repeats and immunoglobulin-like domains protein 1 [Antedon mediterranea]|uniref:leucine-rich repeats and immunoglobulin-like domains protein 1 n=1 Tax=Antedon mediterranea TaxID=105859 RepID=UPI003AF8016F